jgi:hypothetical protein
MKNRSIFHVFYLFLALIYDAGNINTPLATALPSALTSPKRIYNPPEDADYPTYKLRQWTQNPKDKSWCMSASDPINNNDDQLGLCNEECNLTAVLQNLQFWPLVEKSKYYKFRFRDSSKCVSVVGDTANPPTAPNAMVAGRQLQRRNINVDLNAFHNVLAHGGHPEEEENKSSSLERRDFFVNEVLGVHDASKGLAAGGPNTNVNIEGVATGAPSIIPPRPTSTKVAKNESVAEPTAAPPTRSASVPASSVKLVLSSCIDSNTQVFQTKLVEKPGLKNKYYQIISHSTSMCIVGRGVKNAAISLAPCRDNDDSQLWLLEDTQSIIKDIDTTHSIMEYASTLQVADFEQRLGLMRGRPFRGLTPEEVDKLDTFMPGSSDVIGMAFDLAQEIRTYVENTAQYQRSGAPLVGDMVNIFLTPDDYPTAWDQVWGISKIVLMIIPVPPLIGTARFGATYTISRITDEVDERRKTKPPTPAELSAWTRFVLEQCDFTTDSLYKSFLELFRQARISQLRTLFDEFRAGKYYISGDDFYRRYQSSFLKQLVATKGNGGYWVSVCMGTNSARCQGSSWSIDKLKAHSRMYDTYYTSNLPEAAVDQLMKIGEHDNFYYGKEGWQAERFYYTCRDSRCQVKLRMAPNTNKLERV